MSMITSINRRGWVGVADDPFSVSGDSQLDASTILRVRRATHQPGVDQPINHRGGRRRSGIQDMGQVGQGHWSQRTDQMQQTASSHDPPTMCASSPGREPTQEKAP